MFKNKRKNFLVVRFENLKESDEQNILELALTYEAVPISKNATEYSYKFQATTEDSLTKFLIALANANFHINSFKFNPEQSCHLN